MAWEWNGRFIDADEDDGREWVPVTAQTLQMRGPDSGKKTGKAGEDNAKKTSRAEDAAENRPTTPVRKMAVYAIEEGPSGSVSQARTPTVMVVRTPQTEGEHVVNENLGEGDSPQTEETTAEEEGESEISEDSATPQAKPLKGKGNKTGRRGVPKKAELVMLADPRGMKCDPCVANN